MRYTIYSAYTNYSSQEMSLEEVDEYVRIVRKHFPSAEFEIAPVVE